MHTIAVTRPHWQTESDDLALAAAARDGDRSAYAVLIARYRGMAFAYALSALGNREEAEDAAQDAFVQAYSAMPRFDPDRAEWAAWFMRIVRNRCRDWLRRRKTRRPAEMPLEIVDEAPGPEAVTMADDRRRVLMQAVAALPEAQRVPLIMHYAAGRTRVEIAHALGVPESTIIGRLAGGLKTLRRRFGGEGLI